MGTNSELSRTGCLCTLKGDGQLDDEPQDRPLGASPLGGAGSQPSRREKGTVSGAGRKVVSSLRTAYCVLFSLCNKIIK